MIIYLIHIQESMNYDSVINLTLFQATTSFNILNKKEKYKINLEAHFAGAKIKSKDLVHWLIN